MLLSDYKITWSLHNQTAQGKKEPFRVLPCLRKLTISSSACFSTFPLTIAREFVRQLFLYNKIRLHYYVLNC